MNDLVSTDARAPRFLDYPYGVGPSGSPNTTLANDHLRDLIIQLRAQGIRRVAVDDARNRLIVTFASEITPAQRGYLLDPRSYTLTGGERLFPHVVSAELQTETASPPEPVDRVVLQLDGPGD